MGKLKDNLPTIVPVMYCKCPCPSRDQMRYQNRGLWPSFQNQQTDNTTPNIINTLR
jgi:hypothetical protein